MCRCSALGRVVRNKNKQNASAATDFPAAAFASRRRPDARRRPPRVVGVSAIETFHFSRPGCQCSVNGVTVRDGERIVAGPEWMVLMQTEGIT